MPQVSLTATNENRKWVKLSHEQVCALIDILEKDFEPSDLTPTERGALDNLRQIKTYQENKHQENLRVENRVPSRRITAAPPIAIEELEKVTEGKRLAPKA